MLRSARNLMEYRLGARDGDLGRARDFYFDDQTWTVRYLVADTGTWLAERQVLISPFALGTVNRAEQTLHVSLTRQQIEDSPSIETHKPVSRQFEEEYYKYYGWPTYWYGPALWGPGLYPYYYGGPPVEQEQKHRRVDQEQSDPHLRSAREVSGYHIQAVDDEMGHVEDFLIDDETWSIRYLVVDTRNWLPGKKVLLSPQWITGVNWERSKILVDLHRDTIKQAPEYDADVPLTREYEARLHEHYQREAYWSSETRPRPEAPSRHQ